MNDNNLILKNSIFLYIKVFVTLICSLYTSRVLLSTLGVEDFGIYGIVGGIVILFASLRGLFAASIQRFLNVEMGKGNDSKLSRIFSMGILVHIILCIIFFIVLETLGLWILNSKLVISPERITAANYVFQFSILSALVAIMTIPYDAVLIANQRIYIYSLIAILDTLLKLTIVLLLNYLDVDKLILYGLLLLIESILIRVINMLYCKKKFKEARFYFVWDKKIFKELATFSSWLFIGNVSYSLANEGVNILLNIFGGISANAARSIAYQVRAGVSSFAYNLTNAADPQIMGMYHNKSLQEEMYRLFYFISKLTSMLMLVMCLPIIFVNTLILKIWLKNIPEYTELFVILVAVFCIIKSFHASFDTLFKAASKLKYYQIIQTTILFLNLPLSYLLLKLGYPLYSVFILAIVLELLNLVCIALLAAKQLSFDLIEYFRRVLLPFSVVLLVSLTSCYLFNNYLVENSIINLVIYPILILMVTFWGGLTSEERVLVMSKIYSK